VTGGVRFFAVRNTDSPAGAVTLAAIRAIPRSAWPPTTVSQVMVPLQKLATTRPDAVLWSALEKLGRDGEHLPCRVTLALSKKVL
jgi:hypothetical protein